MTDAPFSSLADLPAPPPVEEFASLPREGLIERYAAGTARLDRRLLDLDDEALDTFFRPEAGVGRWSCRVLIGHLADAELVQVHRMRRTLGEANPVLALWDENGFIDEGVYTPREGAALPVAGAVATIHTLRLWTVDWLGVLPETAWPRKALHPEAGEQTLLDQLVKTAWHLEHHAWFLARKLDRLRPRDDA